MKLQKHPSRKTKDGSYYFKYEVILSKHLIKKAGFKPGDELKAQAKKGEIRLRKK